MVRLTNPDLGFSLTVDVPAATVTVTIHGADDGLDLAVIAPLDPAVPGLVEAAHAVDAAAARPEDATEGERDHLRRLGSRARLALSYYRPSLKLMAQWLLSSRESTNFTYDLTPRNMRYLAHMVSCVTNKPLAEIRGYLDEPESDAELMGFLSERISQARERHHTIDRTPRFGRRLGWYAVVRALKPKLVVETGVDKGIGSVLLAAALRRNAAEGAGGQYVGTDINPAAGYLLAGPYAEYGRILYRDSIESLATLDKPIDLFINDSDHSADYEAREYRTIREKLSPGAVILGDNAHATDALQVFAEQTGRQFLFFREEPAGHWYPGAGIGFAF